MVDYRVLLKKYMAVVIEVEGVTFIPSLAPAYPLDEAASKLTAEDIAELRRISEDLS